MSTKKGWFRVLRTSATVGLSEFVVAGPRLHETDTAAASRISANALFMMPTPSVRLKPDTTETRSSFRLRRTASADKKADTTDDTLPTVHHCPSVVSVLRRTKTAAVPRSG
jgi:hypothetical protein